MMRQPALPGDPAAALLTAANEALYLTDAQGLICHWPPSAEQLFGYAENEVLGHDAADLLSTETARAGARSAILEAAGTGYAFAKLDRLTRSGSTITTRLSLRQVTDPAADGVWVAISEQDLTDVLRTEQQLFDELQASQEARSLLGNVLDSARDIGIIALDPDHNVTLWSSGAQRLFACRRTEVLGPEGQAMLDRLTTPGAVPLREVFQRAVEQGRYEADFEACTKGGRSFPANIVARPRMNRFGEVDGVIAVILDLTLRMETLRERDAALKDARAAREAALNAAKTKSDFLANMSHEIRTPMNAVLGMLQLLMRTEMDRKQRDYVRKASSAASDLLHIIDDILDFSKIEAGKLSLERASFSLGKLLKDIGTIVGANVGEKRIEVLFQVDADLPQHLIGDAHRLKQVLINLTGNALKFTEQGEVIVAVRNVTDDAGQARVEFSVSDTGIGMNQEQQDRLFKAFSQAEAGTTRRFGGTGLGLVISQRLVRMMEGDIRLQSEPGVGSTFSFTMPLEPGTQTDASSEHSRRDIDMTGLRVLIVDDNEMARTILAEQAEILGWRTTVADSGKAALRCIQEALERGENFDIAFVDWAMPGLNGWETIRLMKGLDEHRVLSTAIIMVTAHSREAMENQRIKDKALVADYLVKPVTASDLYDAVVNSLHEDEAASRVLAEQGANLQGIRILVVEDNPNNQQIAVELLEQEGARVSLADNGQHGVEILQATPDGFDVVLMDVQMPVMDGYTATRVIRTELGLKSLPIIAVTANVMQSDRDESANAGMDDHIAKPYHVETVVNTILKLCGRAARKRQGAADATSALPASPRGFDFASAYARLGNNPKLYAGQARSFAARAHSDLERAQEFTQSGEHDEALRELHTLKGLAATLGATALAAQLKGLETSVADEAPEPALLRQQFSVTQTMIDDACLELKALASGLQSQTVTPVASPEDTPGWSDLAKDLSQLVSQCNMRALEVCEQLQAAMAHEPGAKDLLAALSAALNSLDFAAAREPLDHLQTYAWQGQDS